MTIKPLTCNCGKQSVEVDRTHYLGHIQEVTGFKPMLNLDGRVYYLCPDCYTKTRELAKQLVDIIKDKYTSLSWILKD